MEEGKKHSDKGRFWMGFSNGLLLGLMIAIAFYFVDKYWLKDPIHLLDPIEESKGNVTESKDTVVKIVNNTYYKNKDTEKPLVSTNVDSSQNNGSDFEDMSDYEDESDEFMLTDDEESANNVIVEKDKSIRNRSIKVNLFKNDVDSVIVIPILVFEVEQWTSPIKNKISYQRTNNVLKIKGIDIQKIKIVYFDTKYYIEDEGTYDLIRNNNDFERLQSTAIH